MKRSIFMVWLIMGIFFVISFLSNIIGPLLPEAKADLHLSLGQAGVLPFAFFIAYIVSIAVGYLVEKIGEKAVMVIAFIIATVGSLFFAQFPSYNTFLISLFVIGISVAFLQVSMWPLLRTSGGEENYSFYSVLSQIFFGAASFISPLVYSYIVINLPLHPNGNVVLSTLSKLVALSTPWVSMYWIFGIISLIMVIILIFVKFPKVERNEEEKIEGFSTILKLLKR